MRVHGVDERHVVSPDGQLEFRIFEGQPKGALWSRLGFQIDYRGKPVLATSWIGLDMLYQEPYLGENAGLMYSDSGANEKEHYNFLVAHYVQNGSLGRRMDVEVRAYDDGIAFRYIIPRTTPVADFLLRDEATQFNFAQPAALDHLPKQPDFDVPFVVEEPGVGWVAIAGAESDHDPKSSKYPATYLIRSGGGMLTNLAPSRTNPLVVYAGHTPLTWLWRVVLVSPDRERLLHGDALRDLGE